MIPNSAADRAFLAEARDEAWAAWCEADVMRRIWGICTWSHTEIEEIACRTTLCRVTVNMPSPGVLASLYTNIALSHLYGEGVTGAEWNELPAPARRYRAVFYLTYAAPIAIGRLAVGTGSDTLVSEADADEPRLEDLEARPAATATANDSTASVRAVVTTGKSPASVRAAATAATAGKSTASVRDAATAATAGKLTASVRDAATAATAGKLTASVRAAATTGESTASAAAALAANPEIVSLRVSHLAGIDRAPATARQTSAARPLAHVVSRRAHTSQPVLWPSSAPSSCGPGSIAAMSIAAMAPTETALSLDDAAEDLTDAVELEADDPDPTASYPRALLEASDVEDVADATAQYPRELLDVTELDRAERIEDVFDEMSARLDALALPAIPSGPASSPFAAPLRPRAELRALGTGKHVIARPRSLTPVSAAAVSRAAEQIDLVELTSSITRPAR